MPELGGVTLQYVAGRGDWKHKAAWLAETRTYQNLRASDAVTASFCRRCSCTSNLDHMHWADFLHRSWNEPGNVMGTLDANVPADLPRPGFGWALMFLFCCDAVTPCMGVAVCPFSSKFLTWLRLRRVPGWSPDMEGADAMHCLWLGSAKDTVGSALMMIAEHDPRCIDADSWDGALALLLGYMQDFLVSRGLDRCTIDEISCLLRTGNLLYVPSNFDLCFGGKSRTVTKFLQPSISGKVL